MPSTYLTNGLTRHELRHVALAGMTDWLLAYSFGSLQEEDVIFADAQGGTIYQWELRQHPTESTVVFELFFFVTETLLCMLIVPVTLEADFRAQVQQLNEGNPTVIPFIVESVHLNDRLE